MNRTNLYILVYKNKNIIKIGKTNNIYNRVQTLKRHWGEVDYGASYLLLSTPDVVSKLEKSLHLLLSKHAIKLEKKDGYTEIFSYSSLDLALKHINYFIESGSITEELQKGIQHQPKIFNKKRNYQYKTLNNRINKHINHLKENTLKHEKIIRLLKIILIRKNRLVYQYDVSENNLLFRIKDHNINNDKIFSIMKLFSFSYYDFNIIGGHNLCTITKHDDIIQYKIVILSNEDNMNLLLYLQKQYLMLLKKIPQRSPLLDQDLPIF
ncbi:GIY-YIG nuclease family protein [Xenorhabdus sp. Reich]|uniref:GIY-YIG nuclease family protein n=1 Tax=Xenorhabdus littoralis TaxID=2582835 RepID=A0ABU4SND8_9GAMM|nr:GIY-YIG nuclease family protein [Xenorhabdus sp. Reich]MDX8000163.1 GIY-YIG nuclease family protein [Xenorhabdus sp. Reich]